MSSVPVELKGLHHCAVVEPAWLDRPGKLQRILADGFLPYDAFDNCSIASDTAIVHQSVCFAWLS
jgi:hypothetical protein